MNEFKQLEIQSVVLDGGEQYAVRIIKQTHRGKQFGKTGEIFSSSCDICLVSDTVPEFEDRYNIYVRGADKTKDNQWFMIEKNFLDELNQAIEEYNEFFGGQTKTEEYRFFCNVADKSVVSLHKEQRQFTIRTYELDTQWVELVPKQVWIPEEIQRRYEVKLME